MAINFDKDHPIVCLCGGVGGAKLAHGLAKILPDYQLTIIVNVGDDFDHYDLHISPDLDTVTYTLAEQANPQTGWELDGETWQMLGMLKTYGETPWFNLGDRDIATHLLRTHLLNQGKTLTEITTRFTQHLGIRQTILPATDDHCRTMVETREKGTLAFQEYFVKEKWQPTVTQIWYDGIKNVRLTSQVTAALKQAGAIIICPSNPVLSIAPILDIADFRMQLQDRRVPCVAVSPLIKGAAVKGPASKIMEESGYQSTTEGILKFYTYSHDLIDGLVVHHGDTPTTESSQKILETNTLMNSFSDREQLAKEILNWLRSF